MIAMTSNKENKPSSDTDWKRNLYVRGLSATTRVKELQKHLILVSKNALCLGYDMTFKSFPFGFDVCLL